MPIRRRLLVRTTAPLLALSLNFAGLLATGPAAAHEFKTLYSFCSLPACADGSQPQAGLLKDGSGNFYGTTFGGGANQGGTVFLLTPNGDQWTFQTLYSFCAARHCTDGEQPQSSLVADAQGNLYGTTFGGGAHSAGTAFELVPNADRSKWSLTVLYDFCAQTGCADGQGPVSGLTYQGAASGAPYDGVSPLFGTTPTGGAIGHGAAYKLAPRPHRAWSQSVIYNFCPGDDCTDGDDPEGGLAVDGAENLYGTARFGGYFGLGTVYELKRRTHGWTAGLLYSFCRRGICNDGDSPIGAPIFDSTGALLGTASSGTATNAGAVFKLVPDGRHSTETVLHRFCRRTDCSDGSGPRGGVALDPSGHIFGTTLGGGTSANSGILFASDGAFHVLHRFCQQDGCQDGSSPAGAPVVDASGNVFGTTSGGGTTAGGTVFEFVP